MDEVTKRMKSIVLGIKYDGFRAVDISDLFREELAKDMRYPDTYIFLSGNHRMSLAKGIAEQLLDHKNCDAIWLHVMPVLLLIFKLGVLTGIDLDDRFVADLREKPMA